ncbi:hypothetical protein M6B38_311775 [Iris pallida]|uniref:Uncharacterized protein n=1 Tax=Iris pallida TaxID=29817 RepID=A0AAX6HGZ2_IRIPA|nr:hypothetical protein M6B38_311775 [Iris pallida]
MNLYGEHHCWRRFRRRSLSRLYSSSPATLLLSIGEFSVPAVQIWTISSRINDLFNRTIDF